MSKVPFDVVNDILRQLPVKTLVRFKCLSRPICSFIESRDFVDRHLRHSLATRSHFRLIFRDWQLHTVDLDALEAAVEFVHPIHVGGGTEVVGSSNGLVALRNSERDMCIFNPAPLPPPSPDFPPLNQEYPLISRNSSLRTSSLRRVNMSFYDLVDDGPWWRNRGILLLNLSLLLALITSSANGFDSSMMNGLQIVPDWQYYFGNPSGSTLGMVNAIQNIGVLVALPMAPFVSDTFGRKKSLITGAFIMLGGVALQAASTNIWHFVGSRGMIGLGLGFATNAAPLLITELAYPTQRGPITAMYNSSWYLGSIIAAWVCFGTFRMSGTTWSWRIPSLLQGLPSLIQVCLLWFVPESPRWLLSQNRDAEAIEVLGKYHANGNTSDPLVVLEYQEIREALILEKEIAGEVSYFSLFKSVGNLKRMRIIIALGFFSQWSGNGLFSYYINEIFKTLGITSPGMKTLINAILQIWNLIMALGAAMFVDRVGRRTLFVVSNAGMLCAFSVWTVTAALYQLLGNTAAANANIALIFIFFSFYDIAYSPLLVAYTIEILPFNIRAKGFAVMNFSVCIALIVNQYVNPIALDAIGWKYALVYCGWLLFEFIFVFRYIIETKGRSLEQTAALFDGEGHADALEQAGYDAARHTQIRTREYENYDYFSIYIDRDDNKIYEMRRVNQSHGRLPRSGKTRRPSERSIYEDHSDYRY